MQKDIYDGQKVYTPLFLSVYNIVVAFNNTVFWGVTEDSLVDIYRKNLSANHLDIGVGTGRLIDRANPRQMNKLVLADININSLLTTQRNLTRYNPDIVQANVLEEMDLSDRFDSVGCTYLLHCIPGKGFKEKSRAIENAHNLLNPGGVFFGATVCGLDFKKKDHAYLNSAIYNLFGWFHNDMDSAEDLQVVLRSMFSRVEVHSIGAVAYFRAFK